MERLMSGFGYCFATPPGSEYPPIAKAHPDRGGHAGITQIAGRGG